MAGLPTPELDLNDKAKRLVSLSTSFREGAVGPEAAREICHLVLEVYSDITMDLDLVEEPAPVRTQYPQQHLPSNLMLHCAYEYIASLAGQLPSGYNKPTGDSHVFQKLYNHVRHLMNKGSVLKTDVYTAQGVRCMQGCKSADPWMWCLDMSLDDESMAVPV
jgi:hypothetical protein